MKKVLFTSLMSVFCIGTMAQDMANYLMENAIRKGFVLLRQDYQVLNEDDEPIANKPSLGCYGRLYTCGVRINEDQMLITKEYISPWSNESIVKSDKRHPEISYSGFLELNSIDFEQIDTDIEDAEELVSNHLYAVGGSETPGFLIDESAGKKKGYAVWLKALSSIDIEKVPSGLSIDMIPFTITTKDNNYVYELTEQPKGNIVGGAFIVPMLDGIGKIELRVNGMFEKRGGVWKFISLGKDEND
ncbi:MAG: hypothetical protein IJK42_10915 [Prevotella sp.]|nr:hypothetical protein [Prevotella sp.]